ncbi:WLM domain-containing protein [Penicillium taxi]|uniref:WLM domain-containing protein n=1 Tax=Penicillium taxi TaxID=168475 RepID=UPI00254562CF|nr:WLM domain-containing protein [Penicillium taxi]KAJ5902110.1 WLM domain-containing protein [Penicillium taxi]
MEPPKEDLLVVTVHHQGKEYSFQLQTSATLQTLSAQIANDLDIPPENQKLLIAPKPGMQKAPFQPTPLTTLPLTNPKFKITLLGSSAQTVQTLNKQASEEKRRAESRATAIAAARAKRPNTASTPRGIHTISSSSANYTFHRLLPLPYLPNPERALQFLTRLRDDPGIRAAMAKHEFSVPLLTEMNPAEHTTSESRTLGLNRNKGEVIELRLRTDAYDGYRDYRTIRKTLCHELAHCVHSDHDRAFWDLTALIEREVESSDWKSGGNRLTEQEFYNPGDWESARGEEFVDECGWTGGEFVLGGSSTAGGGRGDIRDTRDARARAAEERLRKGSQKDGRDDV